MAYVNHLKDSPDAPIMSRSVRERNHVERLSRAYVAAVLELGLPYHHGLGMDTKGHCWRVSVVREPSRDVAPDPPLTCAACDVVVNGTDYSEWVTANGKKPDVITCKACTDEARPHVEKQNSVRTWVAERRRAAGK